MTSDYTPNVTARRYPLGEHNPNTARFAEADTVASGKRRYFAVRSSGDHGRFHLRHADVGPPGRIILAAGRAHGVIYRPIHPKMTADQIEGASYAYDDGEFWRFAHCSPAEQHEFAADAELYAVAQFGEAIQHSTAKGALAEANAVRNTSHAKTTDLIAFARRVGRRVHRVVVEAELGAWHREVHRDHRRELTVAAIRRESGVLRQNAEADPASRAMLARVGDAAAAIVSRLTEAPAIEWRHERIARFYRLSILGTDPVDGVEYVFTSSVDGATITGAANLPDPAWPFDAKALAKGLTRGDFRYFDGYPSDLWSDRPYVIRFGRKVGQTVWTQDPAIRIYGGTSG